MSLYRISMTLIGVCLVLALAAMAAVPNQITYQGRLTDGAGVPVANGNYSVVFNIYGIDVGGLALWSDTMVVATQNGLFTALLGSERSLSPSIFNGTTRYLGVAILGDAEMTPRTPIVSVPYAMVAGNAVSGDVDCHACDTVFVKAIGPDSITATNADTALWVINSGDNIGGALNVHAEGANNTAAITALRSFAFNSGTGEFPAYGGMFTANSGGGFGYGSYSQASNNSSILPAYGVSGHAINNSPDGSAYGGYFTANGADPSNHYGAATVATAHGSAKATGFSGQAINSDNGLLTGGLFTTGSGGTGQRFGVKCISQGNNDTTSSGVYGYANNLGTGQVRGGEFEAATGGTGRHYGVFTTTEANNNNLSYGIHAYAKNLGSGDTYGGSFTVDSSGLSLYHIGSISRSYGTTNYAYGAYGHSTNSGSNPSKAVCGAGYNNGNGDAFGGQFVSNPSSGTGYGAYGIVYADNGYQPLYGIYGEAAGEITSQPCYGGYFLSNTSGNARQYGIYALADSADGSNASYGVYGRSQHLSSGNSYAGYFLSDSTGSGTGYGVRSVALTKGTTTGYGINSVAANRSTGSAYGGYFESYDLGSGDHYGIYAKAPFTGYAGYFSGHVRVTGGLTVVGTKSAAVKMDDGDYRLVYCQESPENWFEDFGEGRLVNGRAVIVIDPLYAQTANTGMTYHVFLTPQDEPVVLAVANRTATSFEVRGPEGSNVGFSYRIVAKRRGYEDVRLARMTGPTPEQAEAEEARLKAERRVDEEATEQDRDKQQEVDARRQAEQTALPEEAQY